MIGWNKKNQNEATPQESNPNESNGIKSAAEIAAERAEAAINDIEEQESAAEAIAVNDEVNHIASELESIKDKYLRLTAEFDNYRKRTARERLDLISSANERLVGEFLPVLDNFARAVEHAPAGIDANFLQGITLIEKQFAELLKKEGLEPIPAEGQIFDPNLHEAIMRQHTNDQPEGTILKEVERGYTLKGKVIRASRVIVAVPMESSDDSSGEAQS